MMQGSSTRVVSQEHCQAFELLPCIMHDGALI